MHQPISQKQECTASSEPCFPALLLNALPVNICECVVERRWRQSHNVRLANVANRAMLFQVFKHSHNVHMEQDCDQGRQKKIWKREWKGGLSQ